MNSNFFGDGRAAALESQAVMPVQNHMEMGLEDLDVLAKKLQGASYYPPLFNAAFGSPEVTKQGITYALAQFMRSMHSFNSKFDQGAASGFQNFTPEEKEWRIRFSLKGMAVTAMVEIILTMAAWVWITICLQGNDWANAGLDVSFPDPGFDDCYGSEIR